MRSPDPQNFQPPAVVGEGREALEDKRENGEPGARLKNIGRCRYHLWRYLYI